MELWSVWSVWLVFCDCGFHSVCPLKDMDKRLKEASWWEKSTEGKIGSCFDGWAMLSKSVIQFSVDGQGCVPSLFCFFTWDQTMVEVTKIMATSFKRSHACTAELRAPSPTAGHYQSTPPPETPGHSFTGKSGSVSGGVTTPFSWVLVGTRFCLCPPRVCFPNPVNILSALYGVNGDLLHEGLCHTQVCCPIVPAPAAGHCWPVLSQETLKHSSGSVSVGSLGPGMHKVCLSPLTIYSG